ISLFCVLLVGCQVSIKLDGTTYASNALPGGSIKFLDDENCSLVSETVSSLIVLCTYEVELDQLTVSIDDIDKDHNEVGTVTKLNFEVVKESLILKGIEPMSDYDSTPKWEVDMEFILQK
ncbi:MAG: hypothetical protein GX778_04740, partial [Erysipelothrix sp.]|nr:hypothetical protein [Erysipelothrix sp.]